MNSGLVKDGGLIYQTGFGNTFETEVLDGAIPCGRTNPLHVPYDLYTELLSGTPSSANRHENRCTWTYRIQPSVVGTESPFEAYGKFGNPKNPQIDPTPYRWKKFPYNKRTNFVDGVKTLMVNGSPALSGNGLAISMYSFDQDMYSSNEEGSNKLHMCNSDGDFLFVPQAGGIQIITELGKLNVKRKEIAVVPRGITFSVNKLSPDDPPTRGYLLEIFNGHFTLSESGPGSAKPRDFLHPTAWCVSDETQYKDKCTIFTKLGGDLFERASKRSPFNVVGWHGNYCPFKYDLERFSAVNSVTYDHVDHSIYSVLTCLGQSGQSLVDFVIFPPRIIGSSGSVRPPWYHRNCSTEFMGLIAGKYQPKRGFETGGATVHSSMTPHGPDRNAYYEAMNASNGTPRKKKSSKSSPGLAFMIETSCVLEVTEYGRTCKHRDMDYAECWSGLKDSFRGWGLLREKEEQARIRREMELNPNHQFPTIQEDVSSKSNSMFGSYFTTGWSFIDDATVMDGGDGGADSDDDNKTFIGWDGKKSEFMSPIPEKIEEGDEEDEHSAAPSLHSGIAVKQVLF